MIGVFRPFGSFPSGPFKGNPLSLSGFVDAWIFGQPLREEPLREALFFNMETPLQRIGQQADDQVQFTLPSFTPHPFLNYRTVH